MDANLEGQNPVSGANSAETSTKECSAPSKDSKNLAVLCHMLGLITSFLGPLILWLMKKDNDAFVEHHGREALNFQLTLLIVYLVGGLLICLHVGFFVIAAAWIGNLVFSILAASAASKGQCYQYPVCIRLIQ
jgi:hypothetical protein